MRKVETLHARDCYCHTCNMMAPETLLETIPNIRTNPICFLDYKIGKSGSDGIVLLKDKNLDISYESHLGNFSSVDSAKRAAVLYFMLARPARFAHELLSIVSDRARDADLPFDYYRFKHGVEEAGLEMPEELTDGGGVPAKCNRYENATYGGIHLYYKGELFVGCF